MRISGYVAAGVTFGLRQPIGGRPAPFWSLPIAPEVVPAARTVAAPVLAPPAGDIFAPRGSLDEPSR